MTAAKCENKEWAGLGPTNESPTNFCILRNTFTAYNEIL